MSTVISRPRLPLPIGLALIWGLVISSTALEAQATAALSGNPIVGRKIIAEKGCIRCHSVWGNGGTLGPDFATVGAGKSLQELAGLFWNHTPGMIKTVRQWGIEWPTLTEDQLAAVISYIYYVKLFDEPGDSSAGKRWFEEKRCIRCHTLGDRGGRVGPKLDKYGKYIAPIMLAEGMWNHGPKMQAKQVAKGVPIPSFGGREIADIQAYIRAAARPTSGSVEFLEPPDPVAGRRIYETKNCIKCHGNSGEGTGFGPNLRMAIQQLRVSEIAAKLWNHSFQMSSSMRGRNITFPRFERNEMADVVAFLYYLRFFDTGGDAETGRTVFQNRGCPSCHIGDGGPAIGPDLATSKAVLTPLGLATAMWNHAPAMFDRAQSRQVKWPRFEGDDMLNLSAYLRRTARDHQ